MATVVHPTYNPLLLTRMPITVEVIARGGEVCGTVETNLLERPHNTYRIKLYNEVCRAMYKVSPYFNKVRYEAFMLGVQAHECSHVWRGSCDNPIMLYVNNPIAIDIDNILSDTSDEHYTMKKYRAYAKYIHMVLSSLKWDSPSVIKGTWLDQDIHTLFWLTRFGVVLPGSDEDFVSFLFPLIISSRRGSRQNTLDVALMVYTYLQTKANCSDAMKDAWIKGITSSEKPKQVPLTQQEIDAVLNGVRFSDSAVYDVLQEVVEGQAQGSVSVLGQLAGLDGPPPDDSDQDDEFYRTTVGLYADTIIRLRQVFMQRKQSVSWYMRIEEGRIPRSKKRRAYKDHLSHQEHRTHVGLKRNKPKIRVGVLCDVSYSTDSIKTQYARAVVCLLAALDGQVDVKTALAHFNSHFSVAMKFGDVVRKTRIRPMASGGTVLHPLLDEAKGWKWDGRENYLIVVTDGDIASWQQECLSRLQQFVQSGIVCTLVELVEQEGVRFIRGVAGNVSPSWLHSFACTLEKLPDRLLDVVTGDCFSQEGVS